jgi:GNAT superfamily N-acetyltransferase
MSETIAFTPLTVADREPIARLLHRSLVHWYESRLGQGSRCGDSHEPFTLFPDVYESLDPGECVTARTESGEIVGVCFSHERETHVSVGIVATSPDAGGRGIAKKMMSLVLEKETPRKACAARFEPAESRFVLALHAARIRPRSRFSRFAHQRA